MLACALSHGWSEIGVFLSQLTCTLMVSLAFMGGFVDLYRRGLQSIEHVYSFAQEILGETPSSYPEHLKDDIVDVCSKIQGMMDERSNKITRAKRVGWSLCLISFVASLFAMYDGWHRCWGPFMLIWLLPLLVPKCAAWWIGRKLKIRSIKLNQFTEQLQSLVNDAHSQKLNSFKKSCELVKENAALFMPQTVTYTPGTSVHAPGSEVNLH